MSEQIVLFDIPSRERSCWSLNPWKTRMLLNYKGLDYRTEWLEYPEVKPALEPHVPPNPTGIPYTVPTIRQPSGSYIMESRAIANTLETLHPSPPLHLDAPVLAELEALMQRMMGQLGAEMLLRVPQRVLGPASVPFWMEDRKAWVGGVELEAYAAGVDRGKMWEEAEVVLREATGLLKKGGKEAEGPFFLGREVSYADFVWGGFLVFVKAQGEDFFEELLRRTGDAEAHRRLLEAVGPWMKRSSH
ncbi:uncharacterized protein B0H64DRAFT_447791 [Chaetomium fimeti]|uniref:GST N-terminal domain-containing protein n=1 Tax=Chaetomium fimeti TaxID=1854472 RepID=A0AAE0LX14_9PEZI|nr:hypothetical protein B0H64DRAFT_447791 [Chaetomium fimeti]